MRNVLHTGLLEAALERSARDGAIGSSGELQFCFRCEMPLLDDASFCTACGTAVRAQAKPHKTAVPVSVSAGAGQGPGAAGPPDGDRRVGAQRVEPGHGRRHLGSAADTAGFDELDEPPTSRSDADAKDRFYDDEEGRA